MANFQPASRDRPWGALVISDDEEGLPFGIHFSLDEYFLNLTNYHTKEIIVSETVGEFISVVLGLMNQSDEQLESMTLCTAQGIKLEANQTLKSEIMKHKKQPSLTNMGKNF